jgi:hypothetical protein
MSPERYICCSPVPNEIIGKYVLGKYLADHMLRDCLKGAVRLEEIRQIAYHKVRDYIN